MRESTKKFSKEIKNNIKSEEKDTKDGINTFVSSPINCDAILVIGGDGFLLHAMREYYQYDKPFVGLHAGTLGFLMNHLESIDQLPRSVDVLHMISSRIIDISCITRDGQTHHAVCINDCIIGNTILDYFTYDVGIGGKSEKIGGTGLVISSSMGSSSYALNNSVPLIPLESDMRVVTGLATRPFHYQFIKPQTITISIDGKSSCNIGCDGHGEIIRDVTKATINPSEQFVTLAFCPSQDFQTRRLLMAAEKLG